MRTITKEQALPIIRDWHARGMLTAQAPDEYDHQCVIKRHRRRCAIGCLLTSDEIKASDAGVVSLIDGLTVKFDDVFWFTRLQEAHDAWCYGDGTEAEFLAVLEA